MAVSLSKGGNVSLSKAAPGLAAITVGLGWNPRVTDGQAFDLDASVFIVGENGKVGSDADFIFYNNKVGANGAVEHKGDNRTGEGDGDDEVVTIDLNTMPANAQKAVFAVTIHDADSRGQNFGQVAGSYIRVMNSANGEVIAQYDLGEDASTETAMIFGEVYRNNGEWKFKAIGAGFAGGLGALASAHGVNIG